MIRKLETCDLIRCFMGLINFLLQGLKIYKYDWNKVWEFCVPHRDPAILPRQWRIALGTQKSYKTSETSKERRRVYEANRRQAKKASEYGLEVKKVSRSLTSLGKSDVALRRNTHKLQEVLYPKLCCRNMNISNTYLNPLVSQ